MTSISRRALAPGIAVLALTATACGGNADASGATLNGGGSSAQTAAQAAWKAGYQTAHPGDTVNYDPVGSGTGRTNFFSSTYSFAGSDSALATEPGDDGKVEVDEAKARCGGEDAIEVPAYVSPIAVVYHLQGVDDLALSSTTLADIFNGSVTTWDDPEIATDNPGVDLPGTSITPVHRSDDSGTTKNFTDWLGQTSRGAWGHDAADTWPLQTGASGQGTSGLVDAVKGGDGTIGYADFSQSGGLGIARIQVGDAFVAPSAAGAAASLADSPVADGRPAVDLAISIDRTDTAAGTYPLLLTSYLIACQHYADTDEAAAVKGYLAYAVSGPGQQAAAEAAGSAPLPDALATRAAAIVDRIGPS